jgi:hypothetical protein
LSESVKWAECFSEVVMSKSQVVRNKVQVVRNNAEVVIIAREVVINRPQVVIKSTSVLITPMFSTLVPNVPGWKPVFWPIANCQMPIAQM